MMCENYVTRLQLRIEVVITALRRRHKRSKCARLLNFPEVPQAIEQDPNEAHGWRDHQLHLGGRAKVPRHDPLRVHHVVHAVSSHSMLCLSLLGARFGFVDWSGESKILKYYFQKMGQPWPLFVYSRSFSNKQYNFYNESM